MAELPDVRVPAEMNRALRENFAMYVRNFSEYYRILSINDNTSPVNFGNYMSGYEE